MAFDRTDDAIIDDSMRETFPCDWEHGRCPDRWPGDLRSQDSTFVSWLVTAVATTTTAVSVGDQYINSDRQRQIDSDAIRQRKATNNEYLDRSIRQQPEANDTEMQSFKQSTNLLAAIALVLTILASVFVGDAMAGGKGKGEDIM